MKRGEGNKKDRKSGLPKGKMPLDIPKMGDFADIDPTEGEITPETDGLDANPGERLEFGFSFSPEEGQIGEENEYYGDMTPEQKAVGNVYDPSLSSGRARIDINEEDTEGIHFADEINIGMAYGKDRYVEEESKRKNEEERKTRGGRNDEGRARL